MNIKTTETYEYTQPMEREEQYLSFEGSGRDSQINVTVNGGDYSRVHLGLSPKEAFEAGQALQEIARRMGYKVTRGGAQ